RHGARQRRGRTGGYREGTRHVRPRTTSLSRSLTMIAQQIINAVSLGGVYALLALGLAIVFSIVGLINFAHGELMTLAGYALLASLLAGVPFPAAVLLAVVCAAIAAVAMERIAFRPMRGASVTSLLLTSFAVSALLKVI